MTMELSPGKAEPYPGVVIDWSAWFFAVRARASQGRDDEGKRAASAMASVGQGGEVS